MFFVILCKMDIIQEMKEQLLALEALLKKNANDKNSAAVKNITTAAEKNKPISDDICIFMKLPTGTETTRAAVLNSILQYIRVNKLQYFTNRKRIMPDETLKKLLRADNDDLTFFNLHRYIEAVL